ncbi:MAG: META domain-containing protein [Anaerolineaceae bacterium]|nr:META domain-containing protein [Anaerolineaceae bacterium]
MPIKIERPRLPTRAAGLIPILIILLLLTAACTAAGDEDNPTSTPDTATPVVDGPTAVPETAVPPTLEEGVDRLANSEWTLTSFGPVGEETAVMANIDLTLRFAPEGQAGGSGGCNTFSAEYKAEGTSLQIGEIISTLIACTADGVAAQEEAYFDALRSATEFELGDDQLMIFYNNGQNVLNFTEGVSAVEGEEGNEPLSDEAQSYIDLSKATLAQGLRLPAEEIELESITEPAEANGTYIIVLRAEGETYEYHGRDGEVLLVSDPLPVAPETGMNLELEGVGTAVSSEFVPEATQSNEQMPYWAVYPAHLELTVDEYAHTDSLQEPKLYLYPVDKFREMNETAAQQIMALEELLASEAAPEEMEMLPFLPLFNAQQMIDVKVEMLTFANGRGVRYLTQYGQAAGPINNQELFYTFQGLTEDGAYYVAAVFPVSQADLPADLTAADTTFSDGYDQYLAEVEERLETAAPATFTPDLAALDAAVQSIEVTVAE